MAEQEQSRTEQPTPFRLQEARERGQVPRSGELSGVLVMVVFSIALVVGADTLASAWLRAMRNCLLLAGAGPLPDWGLLHWVSEAFGPAWRALTPALLAVVVAAVAANVLQTGGVFSGHPLKPDFTRLNPAQTLKRLFGPRTLWEIAKLVLKIGVLMLFVRMAYQHLDTAVALFAQASPSELPALLLHVFVKVATWILAVLLFLALLDVLFSRREYLRQMRMSRRDIRDEMKRREGDPTVRAKRRRLIIETLKRSRSIRRVPDADVVMTNPTHLAVALRYRPKTMLAPIVLAKGSDHLAERMRVLARRNAVPVLRSPELARALFRECGIDQSVPAHLFESLAPVYRWLMTRPGSRIRT
jgi:flagellar biosynthetic protein FlhB